MSAYTSPDRCGRKIRYENRTAAKQALREWSANRGTGHLEPYRCNVCGLWHLGTRLNKNLMKSKRKGRK